MLNTMMEIENTSFGNISIPFLLSCSQHCEHHGIQHDEIFGYTFYNEIDCPN